MPGKEQLMSVAGSVIGAAHFVPSKVGMHSSDPWATLPEKTDYVWVIDEVVALPTPRPHNGQLRVWWLDPAITEELIQVISAHLTAKSSTTLLATTVPPAIGAAAMPVADTLAATMLPVAPLTAKRSIVPAAPKARKPASSKRGRAGPATDKPEPAAGSKRGRGQRALASSTVDDATPFLDYTASTAAPAEKVSPRSSDSSSSSGYSPTLEHQAAAMTLAGMHSGPRLLGHQGASTSATHAGSAFGTYHSLTHGPTPSAPADTPDSDEPSATADSLKDEQSGQPSHGSNSDRLSNESQGSEERSSPSSEENGRREYINEFAAAGTEASTALAQADAPYCVADRGLAEPDGRSFAEKSRAADGTESGTKSRRSNSPTSVLAADRASRSVGGSTSSLSVATDNDNNGRQRPSPVADEQGSTGPRSKRARYTVSA